MSKEVNEEHVSNIRPISVTLLVFKLDKFKEFKEEQLKNIHLIFVQFKY